MRQAFHFLRQHTGLSLLVGSTLLMFSGLLIVKHVHTVQDVRHVSVPLVAKLSTLERRKDLLKEQVELSELQNAVQIGSQGEHLDVYVLPKETDLDRLLSVFDLLYASLEKQGAAADMSDIEIGDVVPHSEHVSVRPLRLQMTLRDDGVQTVLLFLRLAGLLTVGDALTDDEVDLLFQSSEEENPTGIVALEQFLSLNLLTYALDHRSFEDMLSRSFPSPAFTRTLNSITSTSLLRDARQIFEGDLGTALKDERLWPVQFLSSQEITLRKGSAKKWYILGLELAVWERR